MTIRTNYSNTWGPTIQETLESRILALFIKHPALLKGRSFARNERFLLQAIEKNAEVYKYASDILKKSSQFNELALQVNSWVAEYILDLSEQVNNESVLATAAKTQELIDRKSSPLNPDIREIGILRGKKTLAEYKEFMLEAIRKDPKAFEDAAGFLKFCPEFQKKAIKANIHVAKYVFEYSQLHALTDALIAPQKGHDSYESLTLSFVKENPEIIKDSGLTNNRAFMLRAIEINARAMDYACPSFKRDKKFIEDALRRNINIRDYVLNYKNKPKLQLACAEAHGLAAITDLPRPMNGKVYHAACKRQEWIDEQTAADEQQRDPSRELVRKPIRI